MEIIKKYKWLLIVVLVVLAGVFFFFNLFQHDVRAIKDFSVSYKKFDKAISDFSGYLFSSSLQGTSATDDLEYKAERTLVELSTKASAKISSLIKNDAEFMRTELEIADFSGKELDALSAYKRAIRDKRDTEWDRLAKEFNDLKNKRTTAYVRFQELVELTK